MAFRIQIQIKLYVLYNPECSDGTDTIAVYLNFLSCFMPAELF